MSHLSWLHLSDWHQGKPDLDRAIVFEALLKDIKQRKEISSNLAEIDFLIFSGDVAWSGRPEQYELAFREYFEPIRKELGLSWEQIFTIPGNHDLDRSLFELVTPTDTFLSKEKTEYWLTDEKHRAHVLQPFEAYEEFAAKNSKQENYLYASRLRQEVRGIQVALFGLNSAIMCGRHKDVNGNLDEEGKLNLSEAQVFSALKDVDADLKIAVVHHPKHWLASFERDKIWRRLVDECDFVLHGHEHQQEIQQLKGTQGNCVIVSGGASYDRREAEGAQYANSYNFVHLDLESGEGIVYLRTWRGKGDRWVKDDDEVYYPQGQFKFDFRPIPNVAQSSLTPGAPPIISDEPTLPEGWRLITSMYLDEKGSEPLSSQEIKEYYDGSVCNWRYILSGAVHPRQDVDDIFRKITDRKTGLKALHLTGAGGEGKSTILHQVICRLAYEHPEWNILWHEETETGLPAKFLLDKRNKDQFWLIVSDDADRIIADLDWAMNKLGQRDQNNIRFLLSSRVVDWEIALQEAKIKDWERSYGIRYERLAVKELLPHDAENIYDRWREQEALGDQLAGLSREEAVSKLLSVASSPTKQRRDFLGAMLKLRTGEDLRMRVDRVLEKISTVQLPNKRGHISANSLLTAYIYVATLHEAGFQLLSEDLLACVLDLHPRDLQPLIFDPLSSEVLRNDLGQIFIRHRSVAEVALRLVKKKPYYVSLDNYYKSLARCAVLTAMEELNRGLSRDAYIRRMDQWKNFCVWIFKTADREIAVNPDMDESQYRMKRQEAHQRAIDMAEAMKLADPSDPFHVVLYAKLLRDDKRAINSIDEFRDALSRPTLRRDRVFYHEWATAEALAGNRLTSACLEAIALDDKLQTSSLLSNEQAKIILNGLAIDFFELYNPDERTTEKQWKGNQDLLNACAAAAMIGTRLPTVSQTVRTHKELNEKLRKCENQGADAISTYDQALTYLIKGIQLAWASKNVRPEVVQSRTWGNTVNLTKLLALVT